MRWRRRRPAFVLGLGSFQRRQRRGGTQYGQLTGSVTWDLDVWGRIRRQVESNVAAAQVSAADLANASLSAQATLATDYFDLRAEDSLPELLTDTVTAYRRALEITQNQYQCRHHRQASTTSRRWRSCNPPRRS